MRAQLRGLAVAALLSVSLASVAVASPSTSHGFLGQGGCSGHSFSTCAGSSAQGSRLGTILLSWYQNWLANRGWRGNGNTGGGTTGGPGTNIGGPGEPPTTVTPEPVTMTLLATGLAGMGLVRRRRQKLLG